MWNIQTTPHVLPALPLQRNRTRRNNDMQAVAHAPTTKSLRDYHLCNQTTASGVREKADLNLPHQTDNYHSRSNRPAPLKRVETRTEGPP